MAQTDLEQWCEHLYHRSIEFVNLDKSSGSKKTPPYARKFFNSDILAVETLKSLLAELKAERESLSFYNFQTSDAKLSFDELEDTLQCEVLIAATASAQTNERLLRKAGSKNASKEKKEEQRLVSLFVAASTTTEQPWDKPMLVLLLKAMRGPKFLNVERTTQLLEMHKEAVGWCKELESLRQPLMEHWFGHGQDSNWDHLTPKTMLLQPRLDRLPGPESTDLYEVRDAWTRKLSQVISRLAKSHHPKWEQLLDHCEPCKSGKPTKKFLKVAAEHIEAIGTESFCKSVIQVFGSVGQKFSSNVLGGSGDYPPLEPTLIHVDTANCLRGLVWACSLVNDAKVYAALAEMADNCFKKVQGIGPRSAKVGNACLWVFSESKNLEVIAELANLLPRVKHRSTKKQIEKAVNAAAQKLGVTRDDLDDQAVSAHCLTEIGAGKTTFGEFIAETSLVSCSRIQTQWLTPGGKTQKTVPKLVKDKFAKQLKEYKSNVKKLKQSLATQRDRLESCLATGRSWDFATWEQRYAQHPLVGWLSARLIWEIRNATKRTTGIWVDNKFLDVGGKKIKPSAKSKIQLWHPIADIESPELIKAWRERILGNEISQPFKQAHREVYVLTDAERETEIYSNRFASHILKQGQFQALCKNRLWKSNVIGAFDYGGHPETALPHFDVRAEFHVGQINDEVDDSGLYTYLGTDQVRFYGHPKSEHGVSEWKRENREPMRLEEVPKIAFSEVMRDCDLFVGVASVGNDPNWEDTGTEGHFREYWHQIAFGELKDTAKTRREILMSLVPQLKIAERCSFEEKFLVVKGDLRTYKIHLGSSNILMEPNDQYLCIVPKSNLKTDKFYLPFEGDQRLSVILSKAIMLAEDTKIKDTTIVSQISRD